MPLAAPRAHGETLEAALVEAYRNNPSLNAQRASVRAVDENVPQALSGYRPKITVTATGGQQSLSTTAKEPSLSSSRPLVCTGISCPPLYNPAYYSKQSGYNTPFNYGATISQTLFNGFQTSNRTRQAEVAGAVRARDLADHGAVGAAQRGDRLHEPAARRRDP